MDPVRIRFFKEIRGRVMSKNVLIIMSDEHRRDFSGTYGNEIVRTPNIDALAARGARFENAYCNSPLCVPSRASFHTGRYPHQIGYWDNAFPYDGRVPSWGHALRGSGCRTTSIGKLHFRDEVADTGFDEQIMPLHVKGGVGDPTALLRIDPMERPGCRQMSQMAGQGITPYWTYDCDVAGAAADWLLHNAPETPWVTIVSFVLPHFPLNAPPEFRSLYDRGALPLPKSINQYVPENASLAAMRKTMNYQDFFGSTDQVREAVANYYGLCSALDHNIGVVLKALDESGLREDTHVIYTSDHGDNLGARGFWAKSTLWEESAGVPLILAGPGVPAGASIRTPVSLIDVFPTILDSAGVTGDAEERPGTSLHDFLHREDPDRHVFAEYHAVGSRTGSYMLRAGRYKLIVHAGDAPIIYDMNDDPEELINVSDRPGMAQVRDELSSALSQVVDPEVANRRAFADQRRRIDELGGEDAIRDVEPLAFTPPS